MINLRPLLPLLVALACGGVAHAGEFSLGSARLIADNSAQAGVDVTVTFTDHGRALHETAEGGDATTHDARTVRGADVATPDTSDRPVRAEDRAAKPEPASAGADAPHGISISPATAIKRPSYRWQSLVPGTIK